MAKRKNQSGDADLVALLEQEHREVEKAFEDFQALGPKAYVSKKKLADQICQDLLLHAEVEEEIFYPVFRKTVKQGHRKVNESLVEHDSVKKLVEEIQAMSGKEELFDAKVTVLSELVQHHVKEEEGEMFPALRDSNVDLHELAAKMERLESKAA